MSDNKNIKVTTIGEYGPNLSLGVKSNDGNYLKSFSVKKWRMKEERELSDLKRSHKRDSMTQFIGAVLATMIEKVGDKDFSTLSEPERLLTISSMFVPDVFHSYVWLRMKALGEIFQMNVTCPHCGEEFVFNADLSTMEIKTCDGLENATWKYELKESITIKGKEAKGFLLGPARWSSLEQLRATSDGINTADAKASVIAVSVQDVIYDVDSIRMPLVASELDELCKVDIEGLTSSIDKHALGPELVFDIVCQNKSCKKETKMAIDWTYDNFFGISSH